MGKLSIPTKKASNFKINITNSNHWLWLKNFSVLLELIDILAIFCGLDASHAFSVFGEAQTDITQFICIFYHI